jgi:hypothetical protein
MFEGYVLEAVETPRADHAPFHPRRTPRVRSGRLGRCAARLPGSPAAPRSARPSPWTSGLSLRPKTAGPMRCTGEDRSELWNLCHVLPGRWHHLPRVHHRG